MLPELFRARLDEIGIDFAVVYTSQLHMIRHRDDEIRRAGCRAVNIMNWDRFRSHADRMTPAAVIPLVYAGRGIEELEFCVKELGYKAIMVTGVVFRPVPIIAEEAPSVCPLFHLGRRAGARQCPRLRPVLAEMRRAQGCAHHPLVGSGMGQPPEHQQLHLQPHRPLRRRGRGVLQGAVPGRRHPPLPATPLRLPRRRRELGRVSLQRSLRALGKAQHRGASQVARPGPDRPRPSSRTWWREYGGERFKPYMDEFTKDDPSPGARPGSAPEDPACLDDWAHTGISKKGGHLRAFVPKFFFGCEADDRTHRPTPSTPSSITAGPGSMPCSPRTSPTGTCRT